MRDSNRDFFGAAACVAFGSIKLPGRFTSVISFSKDDIFQMQTDRSGKYHDQLSLSITKIGRL